eukprot:m.93048 g.93048  ORF g.93048 m.93048 type:complete len:634 (-) comp12995_c1_seq1:835-2736(-)
MSTMGLHFRTMNRESHRYGELAVSFALKANGHFLDTHLHAGKGLAVGATEKLQARVFLLPNNIEEANRTLFKHRKNPKSTRSKCFSMLHTSASPAFDEHFVFEINDKMRDRAALYRLYFAIVVLPSTGVQEFAGCFSFVLKEVLLFHTELPRWFWLLPRQRGLLKFAPVEHEPIALEPTQTEKPSVCISGRKDTKPNSFINGVYAWTPEQLNGRHVYRMYKRNLFLFYHMGRSAWAIGDAPGATSPFAFAVDPAISPGEVVSPWWVFSAGKHWVDPMHAQPINASFEIDPDVTCNVLSSHRQQASVQSATALRSMPSVRRGLSDGVHAVSTTEGQQFTFMNAKEAAAIKARAPATGTDHLETSRQLTKASSESLLTSIEACFTDFRSALLFMQDIEAVLEQTLGKPAAWAVFANLGNLCSDIDHIVSSLDSLRKRLQYVKSAEVSVAPTLQQAVARLRRSLVFFCRATIHSLTELDAATQQSAAFETALRQLIKTSAYTLSSVFSMPLAFPEKLETALRSYEDFGHLDPSEHHGLDLAVDAAAALDIACHEATKEEAISRSSSRSEKWAEEPVDPESWDWRSSTPVARLNSTARRMTMAADCEVDEDDLPMERNPRFTMHQLMPHLVEDEEED